MERTRINVRKNGPLIVKGEIDLVDSQGQTLPAGAQVALCRCGHSAKKPFCDGSHVKAEFQGD